jgi:hypothetical protein
MRAGSVLGAAALMLAGTSAFGAFQRQRILPSPPGAALDEFGASASISGTIAVVGAPKGDGRVADSGAAFAFSRIGNAWSQQAKLFAAADGAAGDAFGFSVATAGDTTVIGAYLDDDKGIDSGSAYIFTRLGSLWSQQAKILAPDGAAGDWFGHSVAISGTTVVIGARTDDASATKLDSGSAYVYTRSGATWSQQAKLTASDTGGGDTFGHAVGIAGETIVVGANNDNFEPAPASAKGSAYVFVRSGTTWSEQKKLMATDATTDDRFGSAVAIAGDTVLVGAKYDDKDTAKTNSGSAYTFTRAGTAWTQQAKLEAADSTKDDFFGHSVALSGDTAIIGAFGDKVIDTNSGSSYVFTRLGTSWTEQSKVTPLDAAKGDKFGSSVALAGDMAIIGAQFDDEGGLVDRGAAYVFEYVGCTGSQQQVLLLLDAATARIVAEQVCGLHVLPA